MKCPSCRADTPPFLMTTGVPVATDRCQACGESLSREGDVRPAQGDLEWLRSLCLREGYEIHESDHENTFHALHPTGPNLQITRIPDGPPMARVRTIFTIRKPGWTGKGRFNDAVSEFNSITWSWKIVASEPGTIVFQTFIYLTEKLTGRDVAVFLELSTRELELRIESSGILKIANG